MLRTITGVSKGELVLEEWVPPLGPDPLKDEVMVVI